MVVFFGGSCCATVSQVDYEIGVMVRYTELLRMYCRRHWYVSDARCRVRLCDEFLKIAGMVS